MKAANGFARTGGGKPRRDGTCLCINFARSGCAFAGIDAVLAHQFCPTPAKAFVGLMQVLARQFCPTGEGLRWIAAGAFGFDNGQNRMDAGLRSGVRQHSSADYLFQ